MWMQFRLRQSAEFPTACKRGVAIAALLGLSGCHWFSSDDHPVATPAAPTTPSYSLGGTIAGLGGNTGLTLANGATTLVIDSGATSFAFPTAIASGTAYAVTVKSSPPGLTCTAAGGIGTIGANVNNVVVTCADQAFTVGGVISLAAGSSDLAVTGLVLANGSDTLPVPAGATTFTLPTAVAYGSSYQITVKTQPAGMSCAVTPSAPSTMPAGKVSTVVVSCTDQAYSLGGTVAISAPTGVTSSDQGLVVTNTSNGDTYTFAANSSTFTLPKAIAYGAAYALTVSTQPTGLSCSIKNPSSTMPAGNVTLSVTCSDKSYAISGTVAISSPNGITGLSDQGMVLTNSANGDTFTFATNSSQFLMPMTVPYGSAYAISVTTQPAGLSCSASAPSATMPASDVTTVAVTCADQSFSLGGSITGLGSASGLVLTNNGADSTPIMANATSFSMQTAVPYGAAYNVAVSQNPTGLTCSVSLGNDTMPAAAVMNVAVACTGPTIVQVDYTTGTFRVDGNAAASINFASGALYQINVLLPGAGRWQLHHFRTAR